MDPSNDWIRTMDAENFLGIYDVCLDIEKEFNICADPVRIPLLPQIVKFSNLMPGDTVGMRDRYCEIRWKAVQFLLNKTIVKQFHYLEEGHRWQSVIEIDADEGLIRSLTAEMRAEYSRRTGPPKNGKADEEANKLLHLLDKFHAVAIELRNRHDKRETLVIKDEYDVQDLLGALLQLFFDDVRPEEWGPSYAGGSTRVDFFLKKEKVLIEVKKTRPTLTDKKIGEELIVDIEHYRRMPDCRYLICFVYDPDHLVRNPGGLANDLGRVEKDFEVEVIIRPTR